MPKTKDSNKDSKAVEQHAVLCIRCEKLVSAPVEGSYGSYETGPDEPVAFLLLRCPICDHPMLARRNFEFDGISGFDPLDPIVIYPERHRRLSLDVPSTIRSSYEEAVTGFAARTYTASALMCRRTLEALVSQELGKKGVWLEQGLKELQANELIDSSLLVWADMLRVSGNKAAHDFGGNVSKQDAQDLIEFTHALIEYVFTYKQRFEQFKQRAEQTQTRRSNRIRRTSRSSRTDPRST